MDLIQLVLGLLVSRAMKAILPAQDFKVPGTELEFPVNSGRFNFKEHALVCVFAYIGTMLPNLIQTVAIAKNYFHEDVYWLVAYMATLSSYVSTYYYIFPHHI